VQRPDRLEPYDPIPQAGHLPPLPRLRAFPHASITAALTGAATVLLCAPATVLAADGESTPLGLDAASGEASQAAGPGGSGLLRTIVGLVVVIAVIYALTWVLKAVKRAREDQASGTALDSVASLPLGPNRSLHLVRAGDVVVLLGVSEGGVTPIRTYHEEEALALGLIPAEPPVDALASLLPAAGAGLVVPRARGAGRLAKVVEGLRRRTVIK
jgi:flagellar protein FliO/FliZ